MTFKELLVRARAGDQTAVENLLIMYHPLLLKEAIVDGVLDEDL